MKSLFMLIFWGLSCSSWASTRQDEDQRSSSLSGSCELSFEKRIWGIEEDQLDELFATSSNLVILAGANLFSRVNAACTQSLGWSEQELLTRPYTDDIHPEDQSSTAEIVRQGNHNSLVHGIQNLNKKAPKSSITINFENRRRTRDGDYRHLQWLILLQVSGPPTHPPLLCMAKDVTQQKETEGQKLALHQAQRATKMKSTFVAHMSHEIRTPLNGVLGFIELAQDSALLLLEIANDIIDVSRIEAGALKVEKVDFNPVSALESVFNVLKLQAQKKNIALTSFVATSLPTVLRGDQNRFKQILLNLGNNAIKFTSQGKVKMTIDGYSPPQQSHLFMLCGKVKDTGVGMSSSFLKNLFQPFSQEQHSMNQQLGGAGLGLYITKQLCEKMGGSIQVLSAPGLGSTFQFQILLEHSSTNSLEKNVFISTSLPSSVKTVLIVDDNRINQKVLKGCLTRLGCQVDRVNNGLEALEAVHHKSYDLVLMDGEMPHMDGLEATQKIRQHFPAQQLPIIGLTAHAMTNHREQFLASGMNGYLTKPISQQDLIAEILRCCADKS